MSAQRRKIARRLEKSPLLKRELSEMAVESYGDAVLSAARETGLEFNIIYIMRTIIVTTIF
ncbi:TPA: DUF29 domain-containing protein [Salmonella enterica]|uniref:DUF29 domain-containing protein n=1 Tax=Salmonella enterica TaxID=28901 RepID=A0A763UQE8_SALER|nr:DUF29 domain-containing protein [Salmonella enterica]